MKRPVAYAYLILLSIVTASGQVAPPYPPSEVISGVRFDWSTHMRLAPGSDNWPVTWADDGHQYTVWGDGGGFGGTNGIGRSSMGVARMQGNWHNFMPVNIWGGAPPGKPHSRIGKSYGIISTGGVLYMWVGMPETEKDPFGEVRIARSEDRGLNWESADWAFTREEGIMMPTFCNFGKDYMGARDGYVYSYLIRFRSYEGPDDYPDKVDWLNCQKPGMIDLARVPVDRIMEREAYEFFGGMHQGEPLWTKDAAQRIPVFTNEDGVGWCVSVVHNEGLGRYILTTEHTETHRGNMGMFDAPEPWGPWTTVLYTFGWGEGHVPLNTFYWNFSNKWTSTDGTRFTLVFSGRKENDSFNVVRGTFKTAGDED